MFRFRLGRIPVEVHFSHLLFSALLAYTMLPGRAGPHWPERVLGNTSGEGYTAAVGGFLLVWVGLIFVSVLVHELGHAGVCLAYGYHPRIALVGLGGHTNPQAGGAIPWHKDVLLTLAGPMSGLLLGLACLGTLKGLHGQYEVLDYVLLNAFYANCTWTVFNLLPLAPLDGGRISAALLQRLFGRRGYLFAQLLGVAIAGVVIFYAIVAWGQPILVILFMGSYGFGALRGVAAYLRGEQPISPGLLAATRLLAEAKAEAEQGRLEEAKTQALAAANGDGPPLVKAEAQQLLGELAVRQARGREALDHFSQVQGRPIAPRWLAAAFSLVGDEDRALPFWELAARETQDRTVLHEWAGSLLRQGNLDRARRMPGVDLAVAYGCAERVYFLREEFSQAARAAAEALKLSPTPGRAYDAACAHARAGEPEEALARLEQARQLGFTDSAHATTDDDLASLRGSAGFDGWLQRLLDSAGR